VILCGRVGYVVEWDVEQNQCSHGCGRERRKGGRLCKECHAAYMRAHRDRIGFAIFRAGYRAASAGRPLEFAFMDFQAERRR